MENDISVERTKIREENLKVLKEELSGKQVVIKTNILRDKKKGYILWMR